MKLHKTSIYQSFHCAVAGIGNSIKSEANMKFHLVAALLAIVLGLFFKLSSFEWLWIFLAICLVLAAEVINTAIESLSDMVSPEYHPLIKKTKDAAAGAVLLIAIFALICGAIIFIPKIIAIF